MTFKKVAVIIFAVFLIFAVVACEQEGPAERAGEKIDESVEQAGEKMEEMGDTIEEEAEEAKEKVEEKMQ